MRERTKAKTTWKMMTTERQLLADIQIGEWRLSWFSYLETGRGIVWARKQGWPPRRLSLIYAGVGFTSSWPEDEAIRNAARELWKQGQALEQSEKEKEA